MSRRTPVQSPMLEAMRANPQGLRIAEYAALLGRQFPSCKMAAQRLKLEGLACAAMSGAYVLWTAVEHAATMEANAAKLKAERDEATRQRIKAERRTEEYREANRLRWRGGGRKRPDKRAKYSWPEVSVWQPPQRMLTSVWDLAANEEGQQCA